MDLLSHPAFNLFIYPSRRSVSKKIIHLFSPWLAFIILKRGGKSLLMAAALQHARNIFA